MHNYQIWIAGSTLKTKWLEITIFQEVNTAFYLAIWSLICTGKNKKSYFAWKIKSNPEFILIQL